MPAFQAGDESSILSTRTKNTGGMMTTDLKHALKLADTADVITKKYYLSRDLHTQTKPDKNPGNAK
jgi:hypothetical protein